MDKSGVLRQLMLEEEEDNEILHLIFNENGGSRSVHDLSKARSEEGLNTILINRHLMKDECATNNNNNNFLLRMYRPPHRPAARDASCESHLNVLHPFTFSSGKSFSTSPFHLNPGIPTSHLLAYFQKCSEPSLPDSLRSHALTNPVSRLTQQLLVFHKGLGLMELIIIILILC
jgi:hypothetical protein